jgi:hypothetical protein
MPDGTYVGRLILRDRLGHAEVQGSADGSEVVQFLPQLELRAEQRVSLGAQLADVVEKPKRLKGVIAYWEIALKFDSAGPPRGESQRRLELDKKEVRLEELGATRRPAVTQNLEQKVLVRLRCSQLAFGVDRAGHRIANLPRTTGAGL